MKQQIKLIILLTVSFAFLNMEAKAQQDSTANFIGVNPSVTVEPFYEKGEMDINIIPVVYQKPLTRRFDIRLTSIFNLGIRNTGNEISHFGLEAALPVFFKPKEEKHEFSSGFFIAPVLSMTRNRLEEHNNVGLWVEPGYNLLFDNKYAMSFGLQLGGTFFNYDNG